MDLKERAEHLYEVKHKICLSTDFDIFDFQEEGVDETWCNGATTTTTEGEGGGGGGAQDGGTYERPDFSAYNQSDNSLTSGLPLPRIGNVFALVVDPENRWRKYPYGKAEVMNTLHGDFGRLTQLLFGPGKRMLRMIANTHLRYQMWCRVKSDEPILSRLCQQASEHSAILYLLTVSTLVVVVVVVVRTMHVPSPKLLACSRSFPYP